MRADAQNDAWSGPRGRRPSQGVPVRAIRPASSNHVMAHATPMTANRKTQPLRYHFCECGIRAQPAKRSLHQVDHDCPSDHRARHECRHRSGAYKGEIDHGDQREKSQQHRAAQRTQVAHDIDKMGMIHSQSLRTVHEIHVRAARVTFEDFAAEFREHQQQQQDRPAAQQGLQQSQVSAETGEAFGHGIGMDSGRCDRPCKKAEPGVTVQSSRSGCLCDDLRNESGKATTPMPDLTRRPHSL